MGFLANWPSYPNNGMPTAIFWELFLSLIFSPTVPGDGVGVGGGGMSFSIRSRIKFRTRENGIGGNLDEKDFIAADVDQMADSFNIDCPSRTKLVVSLAFGGVHIGK